MLKYKLTAEEKAGGELTAAIEKVQLAIANNQAAANLKLGLWRQVDECCDAAIRIDPSNVKAKYRKAQARDNLSDPEGALELYSEVLKAEPNNKDVREAYTRLWKYVKRSESRQKAAFGRMFDGEAMRKLEKEEGVRGDEGYVTEPAPTVWQRARVGLWSWCKGVVKDPKRHLIQPVQEAGAEVRELGKEIWEDDTARRVIGSVGCVLGAAAIAYITYDRE